MPLSNDLALSRGAHVAISADGSSALFGRVGCTTVTRHANS